MRTEIILLLSWLPACGDQAPVMAGDGAPTPPRDGGVAGQAMLPDAGVVVCPGDPVPCPGRCNDRGYCQSDRPTGAEIRIPAGTVVMGDRMFAPVITADWRLATITRPFYIDRTEVPVSAYRACVAAGACSRPINVPADVACEWGILPDSDADKERRRYGLIGDHPVNCVTYAQAETFCQWKGGRLPTHGEWMLAGRGPASTRPGSCESTEDLNASDGRCNARPYPWGDELDSQRANVASRRPIDEEAWRQRTTTPVGFFDGSIHPGESMTSPVTMYAYETHDGSSIFGVHDQIGNLAEWVADWGSTRWEQSGPPRSETGPATGTYRLVVGGDLDTSAPFFAPLGKRIGVLPESPYVGTGFRCARDVPR